MGKVGSSNIIFIDGNSCSDEQLSQVLAGFKEWIKKHNFFEFKSGNTVKGRLFLGSKQV